MKRPLRAILSFSPSEPTALFAAIGRDGGASRRELPALVEAASLAADALPAPLSATLYRRDASVELRIHNHAARADFSWGSGDPEREGSLAAGLCAALESAGIEHRGTLALADWAIRRYLLDARHALLARSDHAIAVAAIQDLRAPIVAYLRPGSASEATSWDFLTSFHSDLDPLSVALTSRLVRSLRTRGPVVRTSGLFSDEQRSLSTAELRGALEGLRKLGVIGAIRPSIILVTPTSSLWEFELTPGPVAEGILAKDLLTPARLFGLSLVRQTAIDPDSGVRHLCATNVGRYVRDGRLLASACPVTVCRQVSAAGWELSSGPVDCPACLTGD